MVTRKAAGTATADADEAAGTLDEPLRSAIAEEVAAAVAAALAGGDNGNGAKAPAPKAPPMTEAQYERLGPAERESWVRQLVTEQVARINEERQRDERISALEAEREAAREAEAQHPSQLSRFGAWLFGRDPEG